ncbi:uncharacterized protein CLUP02_02199 [Colletotrichum lupini]|uniref:Uncharacterized protein n=1 Tax=Colletotrichum lupini TaxID=145971 RepID=A0A9Q8WAL2_9PEZI|nr:uncharacterized protein CLUP02_02199 [Colletotrichum lupini]UQC75545.1 hypothetical protein CLUP02_02199 [Colletotrichum lupini]
MPVVRHRGRDSGNRQQAISTVLWSLNEKQIEHPGILRCEAGMMQEVKNKLNNEGERAARAGSIIKKQSISLLVRVRSPPTGSARDLESVGICRETVQMVMEEASLRRYGTIESTITSFINLISKVRYLIAGTLASWTVTLGVRDDGAPVATILTGIRADVDGVDPDDWPRLCLMFGGRQAGAHGEAIATARADRCGTYRSSLFEKTRSEKESTSTVSLLYASSITVVHPSRLPLIFPHILPSSLSNTTRAAVITGVGGVISLLSFNEEDSSRGLCGERCGGRWFASALAQLPKVGSGSSYPLDHRARVLENPPAPSSFFLSHHIRGSPLHSSTLLLLGAGLVSRVLPSPSHPHRWFTMSVGPPLMRCDAPMPPNRDKCKWESSLAVLATWACLASATGLGRALDLQSQMSMASLHYGMKGPRSNVAPTRGHPPPSKSTLLLEP